MNKRFRQLAARAGFPEELGDNELNGQSLGHIVEEYGHLVVQACLEQLGSELDAFNMANKPRGGVGRDYKNGVLHKAHVRIKGYFLPNAVEQEELDAEIAEIKRQAQIELDEKISVAHSRKAAEIHRRTKTREWL